MTNQLSRVEAALGGRYAVKRVIGTGGMATVYLAEDRKHHRNVAVKVLRPELAAALGPERFLREIEIAAQLSHPHILPLYDSGESDGLLYYVMPYVEGESLREKLVREGALPIPDAVRILRDVVDALAKAHAQGVVHRDIKPDNVMLADRHAMVTDFGVAKAISEASGREALTTVGIALGTPAYMAPEQATADPTIDHRVDIYALGALAYEVLTGRTPFTGATQRAILAAHIATEPDPVEQHRQDLPPGLATLVMRCLEKKPADRWQSAEDVLRHVELLAATTSGTALTVEQPGGILGRNRNAAVIAAAVLGAGAIGFAGFVLSNSSGSEIASTAVDRQITFRGNLGDVKLSPDGQTVAYVADNNRALVVHDLSGGGLHTLVQLDEPGESVRWSEWSADGTRVFFQATVDSVSGVYSVPRLGGQRRLEVDLRSFSDDFTIFHSFTPSGEYVISVNSWIYVGTAPQSIERVTEDSLTANGQLIRVQDALVLEVQVSPDGSWIAYATYGEGARIQGGLVSRDGVRRHVLSEGAEEFFPIPLQWDRNGRAIYGTRAVGSRVALLRLPIDVKAGARAGPPEVVYNQLLQLPPLTAGNPIAISRDGSRLVYVGGPLSSNLKLVELQDAPRETARMLTTGTAYNEKAVFTLDGASVVYQRITSDGKRDVYAQALVGGKERLLAHRGGSSGYCQPAVSPEGQQYALYDVGFDGRTALTALDLATGRVDTLRIGSSGCMVDWFPDGTRILSTDVSQPGTLTILDLADRSETLIELQCAQKCSFNRERPVISPDGQHVAISSVDELWIAELANGSLRLLVGEGVQVPLRWGVQAPLHWVDEWIYYIRAETASRGRPYPSIHRVSSRGGDSQLYAALPEDCELRDVSISSDLSRAVCVVTDQKFDLHLVVGF